LNTKITRSIRNAVTFNFTGQNSAKQKLHFKTKKSVVWTQKIKGKTAKIACENIKIAQLNKNVTPLIFLVILRSLIAKIKISAQDLKNCASKPKNCMSRGKTEQRKKLISLPKITGVIFK